MLHIVYHTKHSALAQELTRIPSLEEWKKVHAHAHRVRSVNLCQRRYTESGATYEISWNTLIRFSQHLRTRSYERAVPFFRHLRTLSCDYHERFLPKWAADCFHHIAGRSLVELHLLCDEDTSTAYMMNQLVDLSRALPPLSASSPNMKYVSIRDTRPYPSNKPCSGTTSLLARLRHLRHFTNSLPLQNSDVIYLAGQSKLSYLHLTLLMQQSEGPKIPQDLRISTPFHFLGTLVLQVRHVDLATAFLNLLDSPPLKKLSITTAIWSDETEIRNCLEAISARPSLQDITLMVSGSRFLSGTQPGGHCTISFRTIAVLFALGGVLSFRLTAEDRARFETDLDDIGVEAMSQAWPQLRNLSIVQGTYAPRGVVLPPVRTTMGAMLALRDHCHHLSGVSISLDTSSFETHVLQAACTGGELGHSLRKLDIGARSSPVSNPSVAAQILHGLFPRLQNIHDGSSVAWDAHYSDWQEVGGILRKLISGSELEPSECEFSESD